MTGARHGFTALGVLEAGGFPARLEISERVSVTERLGRPPAKGRWLADLRTDQKAKWSGGFRNLSREGQRGKAKSCRVCRWGLSNGKAKPASFGDGNGKSRHARAAISCLAA